MKIDMIVFSKVCQAVKFANKRIFLRLFNIFIPWRLLTFWKWRGIENN